MPGDGGLDFVGRMTGGGTAAGARLRHDTRCAVCGKGFAKGDHVDIELAMDWDNAQFSHQQCGKPKNLTGRARRAIDASA